MRNIEEFIEKDKMQYSQGDTFEQICRRIDHRKHSQMPKGVVVGLGLCCVIATLTLLSNIFVQPEQREIAASQNTEEELFNSFAQENYFDILSDYYPEELLNQEQTER